MVLLPDPTKYNENLKAPPSSTENRRIFFDHAELDQMAQFFIGNNFR